MIAMAPTDPVILITGATGRLGRVVAATFAADGARLGLVGTDPGRLATMAAELALADARWAPGTGDLTTADGARTAVATVVERFGRIDGWFHLVGGWSGGTPIVELDADEIRAMLDQHLWSTFHVAQAVVPGMIERGWGRIVGVTVPFVAAPAANGAAYAVAKAAEETLIRTLAREVAGTGVTANLVVVRKIDAEHEREIAPAPKNAAWTTPEEIAAAMRSLWSDDAVAINGARIPLDGR